MVAQREAGVAAAGATVVDWAAVIMAEVEQEGTREEANEVRLE